MILEDPRKNTKSEISVFSGLVSYWVSRLFRKKIQLLRYLPGRLYMDHNAAGVKNRY